MAEVETTEEPVVIPPEEPPTALGADLVGDFAPMPSTRIRKKISYSNDDDNKSICSDESFRKEAQLHAIDFDMHQLALHRFRIKERYYQMDPTEFIFYIKDITPPELPGRVRCATCIDNVLKYKPDGTGQDVEFCQFCGLAHCIDCCFKTRTFPRAAIKKDGKQPKGKICIQCDRKFLIKKWLGKYMVKIKQDLTAEEQLQAQLNAQATKFKDSKCKANQTLWQVSDQRAFEKFKYKNQIVANKDAYKGVLQARRDMIHRIEEAKIQKHKEFEENEAKILEDEQAQLELIKKKDLRAAKFEEFEAQKAERLQAFEDAKALIVVPDIPDELKAMMTAYDVMYPNALAEDDAMPVDDEIYQEGDLKLDDLGLEADVQPIVEDKKEAQQSGGCCSIF